MKIKKLASALSLVGVALALLSGSASASVTFYSPETKLHDDNLDYVFDNDGSLTLSAGDRLVSVFEFHDSTGLLSGQGPTGFGGGTLGGIADITIFSVDSFGNMVMRATNQGGGQGLLGSFIKNTAVGVWKDSTLGSTVAHDISNSNCGTRADCITKAIDGSLWLTAGLFGTDPDESWVATGGGIPLATVQGGGASTAFGLFNYQLSVGINNTGVGLHESVSCGLFCGPGGNSLIQLSGNGTIYGGQFLTAADWTARSKTDFQVEPVPEPATLGLLGLGLLGLGLSRRGRKQA